jgi:hypothetical protein
MSNATKINLDTSSRVDITCRKGDTFSLRLTITNAAGDAAGFAANDVFLFEVRDSDVGILVSNGSANFTATVTASGSDVTAQYIDFTVAATVMKTMPAGLYVYDIEQKAASDSSVATLIYGTLKVNEDISETA